MAAPWTQSLTLTWRPELSFYHRRVEILKRFEEQGILRAFRVEEASVDAQLFDSRDRLTVRQDGATLQLTDPGSDLSRSMQALELALEEVEPKSPYRQDASFQYIVALDLDFDAAVQRAYGTLLGALNRSTPVFGDWSILVDLHLASGATGQMEFGIIRDQEAPERLSRRAGRVAATSGAEGNWADTTFPPVALFVDSRVAGRFAPASKQAAVAGVAAEFWGESRIEIGKLVDELHSILLSQDLRRVESG